jgi:hypothetical protein
MTTPTQDPARVATPTADGARRSSTSTGTDDARPARTRSLESPLPLLSEALRRRWYLVVAALLLGAAVGYGIASTVPPVYEATSTLLLRDPSTADARTFLRADDAVRLTELHAQRAASPEVYRRAGAAVGLEPAEVAEAVRVLADPALLGLHLLARAERADGAAALADATALAYEEVEAERSAAATLTAQTAVRERAASVTERMDAAAAALRDDPDDALAATRLDALATLQIALEDQLAELDDALADGALGSAVELRQAAEVPTTASSPRPLRDAVLAGLAAALLATAALWLHATRAPEARSAIWPGTVLDAPLLAVLPGRPRRGVRGRADPGDPDGPIRLVTRAIGRRFRGTPGVVLFTTGAPRPGTASVAERTVAVLREPGADVVLLGRSSPRPLGDLQALRSTGALVVVEGPQELSTELTNLALASDAVVVVVSDRTPTRDLHRLRRLLDLPGVSLLGYVYLDRAR